MSSTQKINLDLNINHNFVSFLQFLKDNTLLTVQEMNTHLQEAIQSHYENAIGHSHTFSTIVQECIQGFQDFSPIVDQYLTYQTPSLSEYTIWKPIFNRDHNYSNEESLLNDIISELSSPFLKIRQVLHYFSLIWIDSPLTTFDSNSHDFSVEDSNQQIVSHLYYKGIVNFMEPKDKKFILNSFIEFKTNLERIFFSFENLYAKITKKNEALDPLRDCFQRILEKFQQLYILLQNAKDELVFLTSPQQTEQILEIPVLTQKFRNQIQESCNLVLEIKSEFITLSNLIKNN